MTTKENAMYRKETLTVFGDELTRLEVEIA